MAAVAEPLRKPAPGRQLEHTGASVPIGADVVEVPEPDDLAAGGGREAVDAGARGEIGVPEQDLREAAAAEPAVRLEAATAKAVKAFQSANGLEADGAVGTKTWSKLVVPVRRGQSGEPVLAVQELLGIAADGEFGPETEKATRRFQKRVHLAVDGVVGPHTWQLLVVESQGRG